MWKEYKVTINGIKYRIKYIETEAPESKKIPGTPITGLVLYELRPGQKEERNGLFNGSWQEYIGGKEANQAYNQLIAMRKGKKTNQ